MRIIFSAFFLFQVSLCREGPCPKSVREIPQYHLNLTDNPSSGTCLPAPSGSANWWGVASSIFSMVPVIGPVYGGLLGIIANSGITSNSAGYGDNFNDCIKQMMRREIEITQFGTAQDILVEIGILGNAFKRDIDVTLDEFQIDKTIYPTIRQVYDRVDALKRLFLSDEDGYMQAQFVQLFLDGLSMESLLRLTFLTRLKELNYNHDYFCSHIRLMRNALTDRYSFFFATNYIYDELHASKFSEWPDSIYFKSTYCNTLPVCFGQNHQEVRDEYTANTTYDCTHPCHWGTCDTTCTDYDEDTPFVECQKAQDYLHETMTNIDTYLSNAKETQDFILQFIKDMGQNISCNADLITTTPAVSSVDPQPSPTTPSSVGPTFDECVQAMGGLHDWFTSYEGISKQMLFFWTSVCGDVTDEKACQDKFGNDGFYSSAAPCLHDSFFSQPEDLCERVFSSGIEIKAREMSCEWCLYYMEAFAYLWTQPEALSNGLSILHGECFCGKDGMDADYPNCLEDVDYYYPLCLSAVGEYLMHDHIILDMKHEICKRAFGVCG